MELNWWTTVPWGWVTAVVVFYLIGVFEGRATGYRKRKKEEVKEKEKQPPPKPETVTIKETVTVKVDDPGLLRIKNENGALTLDLDGARLNPISLLPEQRKRLIEMLSIIRPWLEGKPAPAPVSSMAATSTPPATSSGSLSVPAPTSSAPPSEHPSSLRDRLQARASAISPAPAQTPPPSTNLQPLGAPQAKPVAQRPATIAKEDRPAAPAGSMVEQIDAILQTHLVGTPLEERGIFLTQSPEGGVNVYVGLTRYDGIDSVPDPQIKTAIRAAILEWEDRFTPGLKR